MSIIAFLLLTTACTDLPTDLPEMSSAQTETEVSSSPLKIFTYRIINEFPHGTNDFTQGLFIADGILYESTGRVGQSYLIRHDILGGKEAKRQPLPRHVFGEGATAVGDSIISLTWRDGVGYVHDLETLSRVSQFTVQGEGWGLTSDGDRLILSDGTNALRFLDPETFEEIGQVAVTANGRPVPRLNELEYINGKVWANVWQTDVIVQIDPETGRVSGFIDLSGLYDGQRDPRDDVLNGIAYDPETDRLFVTGKNWPKIYEIRIVEAN